MPAKITKIDAVVRLLRRSSGATIAQLKGYRMETPQRACGADRAPQKGPRCPSRQEDQRRHRLSDHEGVVIMRHLRGKESLAEELTGLPGLPRKALVDWWGKAYGRPPPKGISRRLLEYAAAYNLQSKVLGGLRPATRRKLSNLGSPPAKDGLKSSQSDRRKMVSVGSRLIREWHGRTYTVDVQESGFTYDGEQYASLSQVAQAITGARWSGPRFFGL